MEIYSKKNINFETYDDFIFDILKEIRFLIKSKVVNVDFDSFEYIINELLSNSKKCISKRIFYKKNFVDILDTDQYAIHFEEFKKNWHKIALQDFIQYGYYTKFCIHKKGRLLIFSVSTNTNLIPIERQNINEILDKNTKPSYPEGFSKGLLGVKRFVKEYGLPKKNFHFYEYEDMTVFSLVIPHKNRGVFNFINYDEL